MDSAIKALADRQEIVDALGRYCRSMDRNDHEEGYSVWHDDSYADYGDGVYQGSGRGFIDFALEAHLNYIAQSHQVTNIDVRLDGDHAASETYVVAALRRRDGKRFFETRVRGRYLDKWSRRNGRWAIDKRQFINDFTDVREVFPGVEGWGKRDRSDQSYAVLESV